MHCCSGFRAEHNAGDYELRIIQPARRLDRPVGAPSADRVKGETTVQPLMLTETVG